MRNRFVKAGAGIALALLLFAGSAGLASADVVLSTKTKGGETCTTYLDEHGHIYEVCHAPVDPRVSSILQQASAGETSQQVEWVRH